MNASCLPYKVVTLPKVRHGSPVQCIWTSNVALRQNAILKGLSVYLWHISAPTQHGHYRAPYIVFPILRAEEENVVVHQQIAPPHHSVHPPIGSIEKYFYIHGRCMEVYAACFPLSLCTIVQGQQEEVFRFKSDGEIHLRRVCICTVNKNPSSFLNCIYNKRYWVEWQGLSVVACFIHVWPFIVIGILSHWEWYLHVGHNQCRCFWRLEYCKWGVGVITEFMMIFLETRAARVDVRISPLLLNSVLVCVDAMFHAVWYGIVTPYTSPNKRKTVCPDSLAQCCVPWSLQIHLHHHRPPP